MTLSRARGRLFDRPETPREISITERHIGLLKNLARLRLSSSTQLAILDGGSAQNVERALLALWENGYIERPAAQATTRRVEAGSRSLVYGLSRKGAAFLRRNGFDVSRPLLDGIDKLQAAGWRFISHSVGVANFFVKLELGIRQRPDLQLLERADILDDAPKAMQRVKLDARILIAGAYRRSAVVPDGFFGLRFLAEGSESYFMYEKDRGEMPVTRFRNQYGTYFAKKMATYLEASRQQRHISDLGIPNFRVLVETTTAERVDQMIEAQRELTDGRGSNIFLFVNEHALAESDPVTVTWLSGKAEPVRITE